MADPEPCQHRPGKHHLRQAKAGHDMTESFQSMDPHRNIKGDDGEVRPDFAERLSAPREGFPHLEWRSPLRPKNPLVDQQKSGKDHCGLFFQYGKSEKEQGSDLPLHRRGAPAARLQVSEDRGNQENSQQRFSDAGNPSHRLDMRGMKSKNQCRQKPHVTIDS